MTIGNRPDIVHDEAFVGRTWRNMIRVRRKFGAAVSFFRAWGVRALFAHLSLWR